MGSGWPWNDVGSVVNIRARFATGLTFSTHSFMSALHSSRSPPYSGPPLFVEVQEDVGSTLPVPMMGVDREVGVDVEEATSGRLVKTPALERGVSDEVLHAEELTDELHEARRIEVFEDALQRQSPRVVGSVLLNLRSLTWR